MTHCRQPDCTGQIDDGYCDLCGHPETPAGSSGASPVSGPASAPVSAPSGRTGTGPATRLATGLLTGPRTGPFTGPVSGPVISGPASGPTTGGEAGSGSGSRRGELGVGLIEVPAVPFRDPAAVVLEDPAVPENKRFCSLCGQPVGRTRPDRPARTEGFCGQDGTRYSFTPKLAAGDLVAGQYEVKGCLAHGGMGWIYLAADRNLDGRWVVLKGLLNTQDPDALAAAEAERRFLISVDHPNTVKIFNFVRYPDTLTGVPSGYLVMEYVGGSSLQHLLADRLREHGNREALPLRQSIPYLLEVLQAFTYLHRQGMLYCDLKPANIIQVEQQLKLIDLGAVRLIGDQDSDVYGTVGYQAPEISGPGPSVSSDLYTVGRTLAVLSFPFSPARRDPDGTPVEAPLPSPRPGEPESLHRFLRRATDPNPAARFQTAAEMAEQLRGVLREVRAAEEGIPYPAQSVLFSSERVTAGAARTTDDSEALEPLDRAAAVAALPVPLVRLDDPAAASLAGLVARDTDELIAQVSLMPRTPETLLTVARVMVEDGRTDAVDALDAAAAELPGDWRVLWYRAARELAAGDLEQARALFDQCLTHLPGECAPKLAQGFTLECAGRPEDAAGWYRTVWRTDRAYVSAAFGLARTALVASPGDGRPVDLGGALTVLDEVPFTDTNHTSAQLAIVATTVRGEADDRPDLQQLTGAAQRLERLRNLDTRRRNWLATELLEAALTCLTAGAAGNGGTLLDAPLTDNGIRQELERVYRKLAWDAATTPERHALIDRANAVRPWTWL